MDIVLILFFAIKYNLSKKRKKRLMIGIDPLSCFPLIFLKKLLNYKLVFYSVDFNRNRFVHKLLQRAYEKADFLSSSYSDQAWVVCESLGAYKKKHHGIQSLNIPNSAIFNKSIYEDNKRFKKGNKIAWSGSCLTDRQTESLFKVLLEVQKIRPDLEIYLVPIKEHNKFTKFCKKYNLKNCHILKMYSRLEWQQFIAKCDIGIAIYDDQFGSTEFIEPLKIWDFMLGGVPFIISSEPSVSRPIRDSRVAYFLNPHNNIPKDDSLKKFLSKENIKKLEPVCVSIAREFSINKIIKKALVDL